MILSKKISFLLSLILCTLYTFVLIFSFPVLAQAANEQGVISGSVTDKDTTEPLEAVNVYISYTTIGSSTDEEGIFSFQTSLAGQFELVFSRIGYKTERRTITLSGDEYRLKFEVELEPRAVVLSELEVKADNTEWLNNFESFKREFIGTTLNASDVEITNRWVLDFNRDATGRLFAKAEEPIVLLNKAMGYELYVELNDFVWNLRDNTGYYRVQVRFEEMIPESGRQMKNWERNRERAFNGSLRHFLKSLHEDRLSRNRFEVVWMNSTQRARIEEIEGDRIAQSLAANGFGPNLAIQGVKGFILREPVDVMVGRRSYVYDHRDRARLVPVREDRSFYVMPEGNLLDIMSVAVRGYWSSYRMADMVPLDFEP